MTNNEEFEKWAKREGFDLMKYSSTGGYQSTDTRAAWETWAKRQPEIDAARLRPERWEKLFIALNERDAEIAQIKDKVAAGEALLRGYAAENAKLKANITTVTGASARLEALVERNEELDAEVERLRADAERLREAADRAEGFLFAVSLMPQLGPKVQDVALKHHEALSAAMKETKQEPRFPYTLCSNCGGEFGPGDHGFSHCESHQGKRRIR